jgi:thiamine pyrophosphokinase
MVTAFVFAGGVAWTGGTRRHVPPDALVIAADSGVEHALNLARGVHLVVGDFDSADRATVERAVALGATLEAHPPDKDATDLELALAAALARGVERVVVVGGAGGRLDHLLGNALLLASERFQGMTIEAEIGDADVIVVREHRELAGAAGDRCSLFAAGAPAVGVTTEGLRFPLRGDTLVPGSTRGVSNVLLGAEATVGVAHGVVLAVLPDAGGARRSA